MDFQYWCQNATCPAVMAVGAFAGQSIPDELHGMVGALLLRATEIGRDIQDQLRYLGFELPDREFRVVQFTLDDPDYQALAGRQRHNCQLNMYHALREHLAQGLENTPGGILVLLMGYLFGILYTGDDDEIITGACSETVDFAREGLGFDVHVTVSSRWSNVAHIQTAYQMLQDVENSRKFYTDTIPRFYIISDFATARIGDEKQRTQFEQNFFPSAERICGSVQAQDTAAAAQYIRKELARIAENCIGMPYPTTLNLTINRFISLLQYRLADDDLADWQYVSKLDFSRDLISCGNLETYLAQSETIARKLIEHTKNRSEQRYDRLMRDIKSFVEYNATDMNMGLTAVAREFKLRPREAAESFRQYFGESINDVLHKARVKKAKELLLTTDRSVQDIAEAVGYCSLATMYRAFTNVEGVAPGKLRQKK